MSEPLQPLNYLIQFQPQAAKRLSLSNFFFFTIFWHSHFETLLKIPLHFANISCLPIWTNSFFFTPFCIFFLTFHFNTFCFFLTKLNFFSWQRSFSFWHNSIFFYFSLLIFLDDFSSILSPLFFPLWLFTYKFTKTSTNSPNSILAIY